MVGWVLGCAQLGSGASRGWVTRLSYQLMASRRQEAGGEVARDPGANPGKMVEERGGGRYRWLLVRRQSMKRK